MAFGTRHSHRRTLSGLQISAPAQAWLSRTSGLASVYRNAGIVLINGLYSDGLLASGKLSLLQMYATQDETNALINMISSSYTGSTSGSPTFTAGGGYTTASNKYVDTSFVFNADTNFTQNAASIFVWCGTNTAINSGALSSNAAAGSQNVNLIPRSTTDTSQLRLNDTSAIGFPANTDGSGFYTGVRKDSSTKQIFKDGVQNGADISRASVALTAVTLQTGGNNATSGNLYAGIIRCVGAGGLLIPADVANLYARIRTYMYAVGVTGN